MAWPSPSTVQQLSFFVDSKLFSMASVLRIFSKKVVVVAEWFSELPKSFNHIRTRDVVRAMKIVQWCKPADTDICTGRHSFFTSSCHACLSPSTRVAQCKASYSTSVPMIG